MTFKAKSISNDKAGYKFEFNSEQDYNRERPDDSEKWGTSEATNEERRPTANGKGIRNVVPGTVCKKK